MKRKTAAAVLCTAMMALLIAYPRVSAEAARDAVYRCLNIIIPSLFAFMAVSEMITAGSLQDILSKPFDRLAKALFGIPKGLFSVFLLSNLSGYPVGIDILSRMTEEGRIDKHTAERCCIYCFAGGPTYAVAVIGEGIYSCRRAGIIIYLSALLTNLLLATIINRVSSISSPKAPGDQSFSLDLVRCVTSAGEAMLKMCAVIVFFAAFSAAAGADRLIERLVSAASLPHSVGVVIRAALEISNITGLHSSAIGAVPLVSAVLCFGGLCVQLQLLTVLRGAFSLKLFYLTMPARVLLNFGIAKALCWAFLSDFLPASAYNTKIIVEIDNFIPSICLIMMIFMLVFKKRLAFFRRV